jgi:hypothetical protein
MVGILELVLVEVVVVLVLLEVLHQDLELMVELVVMD